MDFSPVFDALDKAKAAAEALGGEAKDAFNALYAAFQAQKDFVTQAVSKAKPDQEALMAMLAPISAKIQEIGELANKRKSDFPLHAKMINDASSALTWVLESKPAAIVEEYMNAAVFNGNKIMSANKGDVNHMNFVKETQNALKALVQQLKDTFPKGLVWGGAAAAAAAGANNDDADNGPADTTGFDMTEALANAEKVRAAGAAIGGEAKDVAAAFADGMKALREFVTAALGQNKPEDQGKIVELLKPVSTQMGVVSEAADRRKNDFPLHCKMMNDAIQSFSWVLDNKPAAIVEEYANAAVFNGNKIMQANKGDANHMSFVKDTQAALKSLQTAVKQSFPKGLAWGANIGAGGARAGNDSADLPTDTANFGLDEVFEAVDKVKAAAAALGGEAKEAAEGFSAAITAQKEFIQKALTTSKPDQETLQKMLAPISEKMAQLSELASKRKNDFPLHTKMMNDASSALSWVLESRPAVVVEEYMNAAQFNGNKIMTQFKGQAEHVAFVQNTTKALKSLHDSVKAAFPKGLTWGAISSGCSSSSSTSASASSAAASTAAAPKVVAAHNPLLAELAKATVGGTGHQLKHVDDSQKLHKQKDREVKTIDMDALRAKKNRKNVALPPKGEELQALQGSIWQIKNVWSSPEDPLGDTEPRVVELAEVQRNHLVCITNCVNTFVKIVGKVGTVSLLKCVQCIVLVENTIGPISVAGCTKCKIIVTGNCPSVQFDKTDSSSIQLDSQTATQIVTGMCSSINVVLPWTDPELPEGENKSVKEIPIPEQFQSTVVGNRVQTQATDIAGSG